MKRIISRHRNLSLALRHAKRLERETGQPVWFDRRNSNGRYSSRGKTFVFYVNEELDRLPPGDYPVKVQATRKGKRGTHEKLLDIRVITQRAASREEITEALKEAATGGSQSLIKVKTIAWSRKSGEMHKGNAGDLQQFAAVILAPEDIRIEE